MLDLVIVLDHKEHRFVQILVFLTLELNIFHKVMVVIKILEE